MQKKYCNIILLLIVSGSLFFFCNCNVSIGTDESNKINLEKQKSSVIPDEKTVEMYYQILNKQYELNRPWISRKEIAAWSAIVLYLSIIMIMFSQLKVLKQRKVFTTILVISLSLLFLLFIHQQYGTMVNSMALQKAIGKIQYSMITDKKFENYIDFSSDSTLTSSMNSIKNKIYQKIRQYKWYSKPFVPLIKLFCNKDIQAIEVEEAIAYDIILLVSLTFIISMYLFQFEEKDKQDST